MVGFSNDLDLFSSVRQRGAWPRLGKSMRVKLLFVILKEFSKEWR